MGAPYFYLGVLNRRGGPTLLEGPYLATILRALTHPGHPGDSRFNTRRPPRKGPYQVPDLPELYVDRPQSGCQAVHPELRCMRADGSMAREEARPLEAAADPRANLERGLYRLCYWAAPVWP